MSMNDSISTPIKIEESDDSGVYDINSSCDLTSSLNSSESRSRVPDDIRLRINSRERQRMHELNDALDALRKVLPNPHGSSLKKLSKLSTLVQAREHILSLSRSIEEMKRLAYSLSKRETNDNVFDSVERSPNFFNRPSAFLPVASRNTPYTSTPIKSVDYDNLRVPFREISAQNLKFNDVQVNAREVDAIFQENFNKSFSTGGTLNFTLVSGDRGDFHHQTVPHTTSRGHLPEHLTTTKENSSPAKPVLKFSVESLLGL
uniref:Uncharacterized protein LOC111103056 n=1 Tax=Crassostrea virginica TaxID=6565 RepID=A0A8B8AMB7_CRAVI|nr:uncharacterized protein LOC111103056 [Crassostrea virginica]